jgi:glutaredoxin
METAVHCPHCKRELRPIAVAQREEQEVDTAQLMTELRDAIRANRAEAIRLAREEAAAVCAAHEKAAGNGA